MTVTLRFMSNVYMQELMRLVAGDEAIIQVEFSTGGTQLATASKDGSLRVGGGGRM